MSRLLRAGALAAALLLLATSPVHATTEPVPTWGPTAPCATATIADAEPDGRWVVLFGEATWCDRYVPLSEFAVVSFHPEQATGVVYPYSWRRYSETGSRPFGAGVLGTGGSGERTAGVCVLASPHRRLACAQVTYTPGGGALVRPIATDDPLVTKPVSISPHQTGTPNCGGCF